ncbi:TPA: LysR family transcriptional regulator [Serratia marcescens]|nr:LysR family transcriptional regulator [Serratia marcescens]
MDLYKIDLNLLTVFDAILHTRGVGAAGRSLGLSQPAVSYALSKLRVLFNDPLFVRIDNEMHPTPRASAVAIPIKRVLDSIRTDILPHADLDPEHSRRTITICIPDIGELFFLPALINRLTEIAPLMTLHTLTLPPESLEEAFEMGRIDLAMGYFPDLRRATFYQQQLFSSGFVCIARQDHPTIRGLLTRETFLATSHVAASLNIRSQEIVEKEMRLNGISPRVVLRTGHFLSLASIVAQTELISVVPFEVANVLSHQAEIAIFPLPFTSPNFPIMQHWHERYHSDAFNQWLRGVVRELFQRDAA